MENPTLGNTTPTTISSVVFVDIVGYSKLTVAKQLAAKGWLNDLLTRALCNLPPTERIVLDTGDGAAISFMNDPEDALFVANSLRVALLGGMYPNLELRIGVNLGPVKIVTDINGRPNIIGDGINWAQRVMGFAAPNQLLVSRSYYDVVSCLSEEYARLFGRETTHRDKHGREHHVYEVRGAVLPTASVSEKIASRPASSKPEIEAVQKAVDADPVHDAKVLATLSKELSRHLGPIAPMIVKKAARKTRDHQELVRMLADGIPIPHEKSAFVREVSSSPGVAPERDKPDSPLVASAATRSTGFEHGQARFSKESLAHVEELLMAHIGPVARLLVGKAAKTALHPDDLVAALARSIDDERARSEFFASARKALASPGTKSKIDPS